MGKKKREEFQKQKRDVWFAKQVKVECDDRSPVAV